MTRNEILDQLISLLPAQLEMVIFLVRAPVEYLSPPSAPLVVQAVDLIRYCEQTGELDQLVAVLNQVREHSLPPTSDSGAKTAAPAPAPVLRCFIAYAHRDRDLFDELRKHLSGLVRSQRLDVSSRDEFEVGGSIAGQMVTEVNQSNLILLLVSPDYLASEALHQVTTLAMQRSDTGQVRVVPIIVRATEWSEAPFARLSALPRDGRAITARTDRDSAWVDVVQGLQLVLKDLGGMLATDTRAGTSHPGRSTARAVSTANESSRGRRRIGDIFRTAGMPDDTFVEPDRFRRLRIALATMGKGLVVEGPSGIGKTAAVKKALQEVKQDQPITWLSSVHRDDIVELSKRLQGTFEGHLVVDDFHRLDATLKPQLANKIKYLADSDQRNAKITLLGVNHAGMSLTEELPDLAGRVDVFPMGRQPDAKIEQLILQGERAANVVFVRRSEFVLEARGSFYTAQQLCLSAAEQHGIEETMATLTPIDAAPRDVIPDIMNDLDRKFAQPLLGFAALDHGAPRRGVCLALLWLLSRAQSGHVLLTEARNRLPQPDLGPSFEWLKSTLKQAIAGVPRIADLLFYDPQAQLLSIEDPRLEFYLRNLSFEEFGRRAGLPVEVRPDDQLIFRT